MQHLDGTIAAIVTPLGVSGVGVIRVSGNCAEIIAKKLIKSEKIRPNYAYHCWLDENIDEAITTFFKSPKSYTGEDSVEVSCHGNPIVLRRILSLLNEMGARQAEKGEFTKRAFLNGKIDLLQAESVLSLIESKTQENAELSAFQLKGGLSAKIIELLEKLSNLLTKVQASIDFADDVKQPMDMEKTIEQAISDINEMLSTAQYGKVLRSGVIAAIVGKPNVGKSSLLNALLKEERAIVTDVPGTTRDAIEEAIHIKGIEVRLVDMAGVRDSMDKVESKGIEVARKIIDKADMLICVFDGSKQIDKEDEEIFQIGRGRKAINVLNKADLQGGTSIAGVRVSALTGQGIKELEEELYKEIIGSGEHKKETIITSSRQEECLKNAKSSLQECIKTIKIDEPSDLVASDLQGAIEDLSEMLGTHVSDDVVERIFSEFCVGK